jgi:hypothetical protein
MPAEDRAHRHRGIDILSELTIETRDDLRRGALDVDRRAEQSGAWIVR